MVKFPVVDAELSKIRVCRRCKARNNRVVDKCRKCGSTSLRPKNREKKNKAKK